MSADVRSRVRRLIGAMAPSGRASADPNSRLVEDLGYDSLRLLELSIALEEAFALQRIESEDTLSIVTVTEVEDLVLRMVARRDT